MSLQDVKIITTSNMSLQVCSYCGWSKVTTYHGLRTHQWRMGCTPRGVKVEESHQQYSSGSLGFTNCDNYEHFDLDVHTSFKTTDYHSDMSLQVCHCGWSKMTTYHGLRTHQGKMGCTPKGVRIPEREQYVWKNQWEEVDEKKHQPAKRATVKKENAVSPPSTDIHTNSAAARVPVEEENKPYVATSQHSFHTSTSSKSSRHQLDFSTEVQITDIRVMTTYGSISSYTDSASMAAKIKEEPKSPLAVSRQSSLRSECSNSEGPNFSTDVQMTISIREHLTPAHRDTAVRPKEKDKRDQPSSQVRSLCREPPVVTHPATVVRPKEKHREDQTLLQNVPASSRINSATEVTVQEERKARVSFATPQQPVKKATNSTESPQLQDVSGCVQVNRSSRDCLTAPPPGTVVQPGEKDGKDQTLEAMQEKIMSELQQKIQRKEEKMSEIAHVERTDEITDSRVMTENWSTNSRADSASTAAAIKEPKPPTRSKSGHDWPTDVQLCLPANDSVRERPATLPQVTSVQPKEKDKRDQTSSQVRSLCREPPVVTHPATVVRPMEKHREDQTLLQANRSSKDCLTAPPPGTVVQPGKKDGKDQTLEAMQEKITSELQQKIQQIEEKMSEIARAERPDESIPDSVSTDTQMNSAAEEATTKEDSNSLHETDQPDFSTGLKVKELAQMFSAAIDQQAAVQPKWKHREELKPSQVKHFDQRTPAATAQENAGQVKEKDEEVQKLPQNVPDSTRAAAQMNPALAENTTEKDPEPSCEPAEVSDFSAGMKVKELAQMFSATTSRETAGGPKREKRREEREKQKPSQVKLTAPKHSATAAQGADVRPKVKPKKKENVQDSTSTSTQMIPASARPATEEDQIPSCETAQLPDFSTGVKVKDLARMFSAITAQQTAARPKWKHRAEQKENRP